MFEEERGAELRKILNDCRVELEPGQLKLTSGRVTEWYYDFDLLTPRQARDISLMLIKAMPYENVKVDFIVAPAVGGIVPAFFVGEWIDKPVVTVDKDGRCRGRTFKPGSTYLIVDDVVSTYGEVDRCKAIFHEHDHRGTMAYIYRGVGDMREDTIVLDRREPEYEPL
jgi:orotate phosphoribosyltransferase